MTVDSQEITTVVNHSMFSISKMFEDGSFLIYGITNPTKHRLKHLRDLPQE